METAADVVVAAAGHRGVLISGTVNATTKTATITSALPLPYSGDAAPGAGTTPSGSRTRPASVLAERRFTPNVRFGDGDGRRPDRGASPRSIAIPAGGTIGKVTVVNATDGALGTRSAAAGPHRRPARRRSPTRGSSATRSR